MVRAARFTVGRMMIAVAAAAAAVALGMGLEMARRRERFSALARRHCVKAMEGGSLSMYDSREHLRRLEAERARHEAMCRKYRRAAALPWLPVAPDPPGPERPAP